MKDTDCSKAHPDAPHGFNRNASHTEDRYVCDCEGWEPPELLARDQKEMIEDAQGILSLLTNTLENANERLLAIQAAGALYRLQRAMKDRAL